MGTVTCRYGWAHISPIVHILRVPSGCNSRVGGKTAVDSVDTSEGVYINLQIGQSDIGAWLERCSIASSSRIKEVDGGENSVGINSRTTTASVGSEVAAVGVFVGLNGWSARKCMDGMKNAYLLEAQEVGCLYIIPRNDVCLTKLLSEGNTFPQRPVLNGSGEEGRRVDLLPQVETGGHR